MEIIFRPVTKEDAEGFSILMDHLSKRASSTELLLSQIDKATNNKDMYLMCAEVQGKLVGSLIGLICEDFCGDCRPVLFIENVITLKELQGRGIGRKMFEEIERWGKERNCNYSVLVSALGRTGAHKFYNALGYAEAKGYKKYL